MHTVFANSHTKLKTYKKKILSGTLGYWSRINHFSPPNIQRNKQFYGCGGSFFFVRSFSFEFANLMICCGPVNHHYHKPSTTTTNSNTFYHAPKNVLVEEWWLNFHEEFQCPLNQCVLFVLEQCFCYFLSHQILSLFAFAFLFSFLCLFICFATFNIGAFFFFGLSFYL